MASIRHVVTIEAPSEKIYDAITEKKGISSWWTDRVEASPEEGSVGEFNFGDYKKRIKVEKLDKGKQVAWKCIDAHPEWVDTDLVFNLEEKDGQTLLSFQHDKWKSETKMFGICNYNWALYLKSLKDYAEGREGSPYKNL